MMVEATGRITKAVSCPVSADIEAGYGYTLEEVLQTVRAIINAGAIGINIEDSTTGRDRSLVEASFQVELLKAIRETAQSMDMPLVINARTDIFLLAIGDPAGSLDQAMLRGSAYRQAGADCIFPIGLSDANLIAHFVQAINGPINVLAGATTPSVPELAQLGVARVSFASGPMRATLGYLRLIANELHEHGTYTNMNKSALSGAEFRYLFGQ
jgi:2-methylisocitrate lyase-like PEP mutase family enzyme